MKKSIRTEYSNLRNTLSNVAKIPIGTNKKRYNCWGLTSALFGWTDLIWTFQSDMKKLLSKNSYPIKKLRVGDIVVYHDNDGLSHTAVVTKLNYDMDLIVVLHKPGKREVETSQLDSILLMYGDVYGKVFQFRRAKGSKRIAAKNKVDISA